MQYLRLIITLFICILPFSPAGAQSGYGTGGGFDPISPGVPGANGLYLEQGLVVIDQVKGSDYDALDEAVYNLWQSYCKAHHITGDDAYMDSQKYQEMMGKVRQVVVCADLSAMQYGLSAGNFGRLFPKMQTLDLSRTYGWTAFEAGDSEYLESLEVIILPDCVEQVYTLKQLHRLTDVYCYAELPPVLQKTGWYDLDELFADDVEVKVHVPAGSLPLYQASETWGKYTIVDIETNLGKLEVKMPQGQDISQYRNMYIVLTDEQSQLATRYIVNDRQSYFFPGLRGDEGASYAASLVNRFGTVVCQATGITLNAGITQVQLKDPLPVVIATVKAPEQLKHITWYDAQGDPITTATTLAGLVAGDVVTYDAELTDQQARLYAPLTRQTLTIPHDATGTVTVSLPLQPLSAHTLVGFLRDAANNMPLHEISVSAIRSVNGKDVETYSTLTYTDGRFIVPVHDGQVKLSFASKDYLRRDVELFIDPSMPSTYATGDYLLQRAKGKTVSLSFSHTVAGVGAPAGTYSFFSGFNDMLVTVSNETSGQQLNSVSVQLPQIIVLSGADDDDLLRLDFSSASGAFDPFSVSVQLSGGSASAQVNIVDKGGFSSTFTATDNGRVAAIVYDAEGNYLNHYLHTAATLSVSGLSEGDYTLVTMAYDPVLSQLTTLQQLTAVGMQRDVDYLQRPFHVSPGVLTVIEQGQVPTINVEQLKAIHPSTTFSVLQNEVTLGSYVTVRSRVKVKNEIAQDNWSYDDFRLLFQLPRYCSYLEGSLLVDGEPVEPGYEDDCLVVRAGESLQRGAIVDVRFCLVGKTEGHHQVAALLGYHKYDWQSGDQDFLSPVGTAQFTVMPMQYEIDPVSTGHLVARGTAPRDAVVSAYEDQVLLGQTTVSGDSWVLDVPLPASYNLSKHPVHIECVTKEQNVYTTPVTNVTLNTEQNRISKVTMLYPNAYAQKTITCTWDFIHPDNVVESYDFDPSSTAFTFLIDFLQNDTAAVGDVVLDVEFSSGRHQDYDAAFDEQRGCWVVALDVKNYWSTSDAPVHVAVAFTDKQPRIRADRQHLAQEQADVYAFIGEVNTLIGIMAGANEQNIRQKWTEFETALGMPLLRSPSDETRQWMQQYAAMTETEAEAAIDELLAECEETSADIADLLSVFQQPLPTSANGDYSMPDGTALHIADCHAYDESRMEEQGFQRVETTDGTSIYILEDDFHCVVVDFATNTAMELVLPPATAGPRRDVMEIVQKAIQETANLVDKVTGLLGTLISSVGSKIEVIESNLLKLENELEQLEKIVDSSNTPTWKRAACGAIMMKKYMELPVLRIALKVAQKVPLLLRKILPVANYVMLAVDVAARGKKVLNMYNAVPVPCPNDELGAQNCRDRCERLAYFLLASVVTKFAVQAGLDMATASGVATSFETAGVSLLVSVGAYLAKVAANWALEEVLNKQFDSTAASIATAISKLDCKEKEEEKPKDPGTMDYSWKPGKQKPFTPKKRRLIDPSGFVCEAVESNRLQGVTATCLYKKLVEDMYGDTHEEVVVWDAENYGQQNPLLTDRDGMYSWMVPEGQWQVLYQKDGFETQRSAWLPVPPPQLDVNVGMVRRQQPTVQEGHAYERAIDLSFSLYMKQQYVTPQTVTFWQDGQQLQGQLQATNSETAFGTPEEDSSLFTAHSSLNSCASLFRFVPKKALAVGSLVTVRVNSIVRSYADVAMGQDQELTLTVGREVTGIGSDGTITVPYGGTHQVVIAAQTPAAAAYRNVTISSLSPSIAALQTDRVVLDANGKAYITVMGLLPGTTYLSYAVEGSQVQAMDTVHVVSDFDFVAAPQASLISGTFVSQGTQVALTAQPGCTIWYTLDGTCPCDAATRQQYTAPITISANTTLKAMAVTADGRESEVVTFTWFIGTAIAALPTDSTTAPAATYDLQGRRRDDADRPAAGQVLIIDGRKVAGSGR